MAKGKQRRRRRRKYITKLCEICATYDHRTVDILNKILAKYALLCIKPESRIERQNRPTGPRATKKWKRASHIELNTKRFERMEQWKQKPTARTHIKQSNTLIQHSQIRKQNQSRQMVHINDQLKIAHKPFLNPTKQPQTRRNES